MGIPDPALAALAWAGPLVAATPAAAHNAVAKAATPARARLITSLLQDQGPDIMTHVRTSPDIQAPLQVLKAPSK